MITQNKYNRSKQVVDGNFKVPSPISSEKITYPFEGDINSYLMDQEYMIYSDYYLETMPAIGSPHPDYSGMYFIKDSPINDINGGIITFTRTYGILPGFNSNESTGNNIRKESESFVWTKPGINTVDLYFENWWIDKDAITYPTSDTIKLSTQTKSAGVRFTHDINNNYTRATVTYFVSNPTTNYQQLMTYTPEIISKGTDYIIVNRAPYSNANTETPIEYYFFSRPQIYLRPMQIVVNSIVYYDYWLPGLNCSNIENIDLLGDTVFTIIDAQGNQTDSISEDTTPPLFTNLNHKGYIQMVQDKDLILAENPILRRWNGPIYERQRRYITII